MNIFDFAEAAKSASIKLAAFESDKKNAALAAVATALDARRNEIISAKIAWKAEIVINRTDNHISRNTG